MTTHLLYLQIWKKQCRWQLGQKTPFRWHEVCSELQNPRHARVVAIAIKQTQKTSAQTMMEKTQQDLKKRECIWKKNHNWRYKNYQNFSRVTHVSTDTLQMVCWSLCLRPVSGTDYAECTACQISVCSLKLRATEILSMNWKLLMTLWHGIYWQAQVEFKLYQLR